MRLLAPGSVSRAVTGERGRQRADTRCRAEAPTRTGSGRGSDVDQRPPVHAREPQRVARLEVAVDDADIVQALEALRDVPHDLDRRDEVGLAPRGPVAQRLAALKHDVGWERRPRRVAQGTLRKGVPHVEDIWEREVDLGVGVERALVSKDDGAGVELYRDALAARAHVRRKLHKALPCTHVCRR